MATIKVEEKYSNAVGSEETIERGRMKRRVFWVSTRDEFAALDAPGVPRMSDQLSSSYPEMVVINRAARPLGGINNAEGVNGVSEIIVTYGSMDSQFAILPKEVQPPGVKHTVITFQNESVEIGIDVDDNGNPRYNRSGPETFNAGRPATKLAGRMVAEIYDFKASTYQVPYPTLISIATDKALNKDQITLPPPIGTTTEIVLAPKQALYMGFRVEARPDALLIVHELAVAQNFDYKWAVIDGDAKVTSQGTGQLYRAVLMGGLW